MTLPVQFNPISFNQVNVELGLAGTTLITLNQANVRTLAGVGGAGTIITMNNLHGKSAQPANPIDITEIGDYKISPVNPSASLTFNTNGTLSKTGTTSFAGTNWYTPTTGSIGNSYWVRMQVTTGTNPNGGDTVNVWHPLSSSRFWSWSRTINGITSATVRFDISTDSSGTTIVATKTGVSVAVERDV